jgi:DNA-binding beta-propeller fold protein YncE
MLTTVAEGRCYDYSHSLGRSSQSGMGFYFPCGVTLSENGTTYVINRGAEVISNVPWDKTGVGARVSIITLGSAHGEETFDGEFGKYGSGPGEFIWPTGIVLSSDNKLYVTDEYMDRVSTFDSEGNFLSEFYITDQPGTFGAAGIAIDKDDNLYITGGFANEIRKYSTSGELIKSWGELGSDEGQLNRPWGITIDAKGTLYVADHKNHRIQLFDTDGTYIRSMGSYGNKYGELDHPTAVAVDNEGDIYVSDWAPNTMHWGKVHIFKEDGSFITALEGDAVQLSKWAEMTIAANTDYLRRRREVKSTESEWSFVLPAGVSFDHANNRLIVSDSQRSRIQVYNKVEGYMVPQLNL